jgi:hypothetical protein
MKGLGWPHTSMAAYNTGQDRRPFTLEQESITKSTVEKTGRQFSTNMTSRVGRGREVAGPDQRPSSCATQHRHKLRHILDTGRDRDRVSTNLLLITSDEMIQELSVL